MAQEKQINEFVTRLRQAGGENLESVILYGSAADGEYHPQFSNINLLCVLRETSFASVTSLASAVEWWKRQKHAAPLILTAEELRRSADVFAIEFTDMKQRYRLIFGNDVVSGLQIPMHLHRAQVEYELRAKLILLRERLLVVGTDKQQLWALLLSSVSAFSTLFRHALIALNVAPPASKREAVNSLSEHIAFDPSAFLQVLDIRERKLIRNQLDVTDIFSRYLTAVQQVAAAVDTMLDSGQPAS